MFQLLLNHQISAHAATRQSQRILSKEKTPEDTFFYHKKGYHVAQQTKEGRK